MPKPVKRTKKFIDKKNSITFHLVHRSQRDPLQADEDAPQRVLVSDDPTEDVTRIERLRTAGIYYDDDYDYEQHLKVGEELNKVEPDTEFFTIGSRVRHALPDELFPSVTEQDIGMLELAAPVSGPQLDLDPDVLAALDSDNEEFLEDDENLMEDDFVTQANQSRTENDDPLKDDNFSQARRNEWLKDQAVGFEGIPDDSMMPRLEGDEEISSDFNEDSGDDEVGSMPDFSDEETKTRFTNYSMSSSVIRRNQGLSLVDDRFEQMFAEYGDDEIGALDHEEIDGRVSTAGPMMKYLLEQFDKQQIKLRLDEEPGNVNLDLIDSDSSEDMEKVVVDERGERQFDCESILSTYSNLYNHPKLIQNELKKKKSGTKIELSKKLGIPLESLPTRGLTRRQLKQLDNEQKFDAGNTRTADETPEQRRQRKLQVEAERKERRVEKKNTKVAFKQEEAEQRRQQINNRSNLQAKQII